MSKMTEEELNLFRVDVLLNERAQTCYTQLEAWNQTVRLYREWESVGRVLDFRPVYYNFSSGFGRELMDGDFKFMDKIARGEA